MFWPHSSVINSWPFFRGSTPLSWTLMGRGGEKWLQSNTYPHGTIKKEVSIDLLGNTPAWKSEGFFLPLLPLLTYSETLGNLIILTLTSSTNKMRKINLVISKGPFNSQILDTGGFYDFVHLWSETGSLLVLSNSFRFAYKSLVAIKKEKDEFNYAILIRSDYLWKVTAKSHWQ